MGATNRLFIEAFERARHFIPETAVALAFG
jgi:hypothetical protein